MGYSLDDWGSLSSWINPILRLGFGLGGRYRAPPRPMFEVTFCDLKRVRFCESPVYKGGNSIKMTKMLRE